MTTNSLEDVYNAAMGNISAAMIEENANFQKASVTGNFDEQVRASQELAHLRALQKEYQAMATETANQMRTSAPSNKYGLSEDECQVAANSYTDPTGRMTADDKQRVYAEQKQKHRSMVASGAYSVDQGSLKRG